MDAMKLNLDNNAFKELKSDFNLILKKTLDDMNAKDSNEATITIKINITLEEIEVPDYEMAYPDAKRIVDKPRFDHKISSVMQTKTEKSGSLIGNYELVWDSFEKAYIMKPIDNRQQAFPGFYEEEE